MAEIRQAKEKTFDFVSKVDLQRAYLDKSQELTYKKIV